MACIGAFWIIVIVILCIAFPNDYQDIFMTIKKLWRTSRILVATMFYLIASLVLIISLKMYPKDLRQEAKDSFI